MIERAIKPVIENNFAKANDKNISKNKTEVSPVENKETAFGILICGSGNGVAITANKHQHIRAAICWGEELAELARKHNDANIICIPSRFVREGDVEKMVDIFMHTDFEGGRHQKRKEKIACA